MKQIVWSGFLFAVMLTTASASDPAPATEAKSIEQLTAPCAACHGPTGISPSGAFPTIAGQHPSYLERSLQDYQSGKRKNVIMAGQVTNLSKREIKALAAWFAAQEGPLYTPSLD